MPAFSFVHAADFQLDSPFVGLGRLPEGQSQVVEHLREATFRAFESVVELCLEKRVDFLLVAGDVYDGADRSLKRTAGRSRGFIGSAIRRGRSKAVSARGSGASATSRFRLACSIAMSEATRATTRTRRAP